MFDHLIHDLQMLRKADFLIGKIWFAVLARRFGLAALAGLIALFGLGMGNVAGFYALQAHVGAVWAAALVGLIDFVVAAFVWLAGSRSHPGPEIDVALEVRKMALESIQADARDLKLVFDNAGSEIRNLKSTIAGLVQNPLDAAAQKVLIPAALSLLRGLRSKKAHS
jgi:hypothetical protein